MVRIPSVSAPAFDAAQVRRSAEHVAATMRRHGMPDARLLESRRCPSCRIRRDRRPGRLPDGVALRPSRRPATGARPPLDVSAVRAGGAGRPALRQGQLRRQGRDRGSPRGDRRPRRAPPGRGQGVRGRRGGDRLGAPPRLHRPLPRPARCRRLRHRRFRQLAHRGPGGDRLAARAGGLRRRGAHPGEGRPQRPVRRRLSRCADDAVPAAGDAARRRRERRHRRPGRLPGRPARPDRGGATGTKPGHCRAPS